MAKIGTAHIEIKPVLSDEALDELAKRIEDAVALGVQRGMYAIRNTDARREALTRQAERVNGSDV